MKNLFVSILASAVISAGLLWYYDHAYATKIAVIDMDGYVARLKTDYIHGKLTRKELDENLQQLSRQIRENYSKNTVLLLKEVVINGNVQNFNPDR